jgi:D-methionine transport system ATP-binding protein
MSGEKNHLVLENISKSYAGQIVLQDVSLSLGRGCISGIIGKSGAGKSSLLRCANFLVKPDTGRVLINGVCLNDLSASELRLQRRKIGMIFQHFNLLSSATVYDNIALPLKLAGQNEASIQKKVSALAELTELSDRLNHYPAQLSGGQKQRVAISRALVNDPTLLLCDEATSALDPETTQSILTLLKTINKELNLSILLITHEMEVIKNICDEVMLLDKGCVIEQSDVLTFFRQPQTDLAQKLVRTILKLDLPERIQERLHIERKTPTATPVLGLKFIGHQTIEPIISNLASQYHLGFSILQANIELIQDQTVGVLILEIFASEDKMRAGISYLKAQGVQVEVVGYAHDD